MTPRDRWKEIEVILNSALPKEESVRVVALIKESVQYEANKTVEKMAKETLKN
jgi:hypothetical protein